MNTLIKGLQKQGFTVWFTANDEFNIMDYETIRTFANVKKGPGRKVLIKTSLQDEFTTCGSQKEALQWFLSNYR